MAVVTLLKIYADFLGSLHLETVHSFPCLGDIDLVVVIVAHFHSLLFAFLERSILSEESMFLSANIALPKEEKICFVYFGKRRKLWKNLG